MPPKPASEQMSLFEELPNVPERATAERPEPATLCVKCKEQYLSDRQVASRFNISKATVWRWHENNPDFPRRLKLSPGTSRWRLSDLVRFETKRRTADPFCQKLKAKGQPG